MSQTGKQFGHNRVSQNVMRGFGHFFPRQSAGLDFVPTGSAQKEIWELLHQNIHLKMEVAGPEGLVQKDSPEVTE